MGRFHVQELAAKLVHIAILGAKYDRPGIGFPVPNLCSVDECGYAGSVSEVDGHEMAYVKPWMHPRLYQLLFNRLGSLSLLFIAIPTSKCDSITWFPPCENSINRRA